MPPTVLVLLYATNGTRSPTYHQRYSFSFTAPTALVLLYAINGARSPIRLQRYSFFYTSSGASLMRRTA
eukprot:gene1232-986_t